MDKRTLIKSLNRVFCDFSKEGKRYSEVWLEEADFGGLYMSGKFILRVKARHDIDSSCDDIRNIVFRLYEKVPGEYNYIYQVAAYRHDNRIHCQSNDLIVYEEDTACS